MNRRKQLVGTFDCDWFNCSTCCVVLQVSALIGLLDRVGKMTWNHLDGRCVRVTGDGRCGGGSYSRVTANVRVIRGVRVKGGDGRRVL